MSIGPLVIGVGLMTIGLVILAVIWRSRSVSGRAAARNVEPAAAVSPSPHKESTVVSHRGFNPQRGTQNDLQSTIYDMAQGLVVKADELTNAAVGAAEEEVRMIEGDARVRSDASVAQAENEAHQIRHDATQEAKRTVQGAMYTASRLQAESRAFTDSARAEISSSVTALNKLLGTLSNFNGVDAKEPHPGALEADHAEREPVTRSVKDDVVATFGYFKYLRRTPQRSEGGHNESASFQNGTPG